MTTTLIMAAAACSAGKCHLSAAAALVGAFVVGVIVGRLTKKADRKAGQAPRRAGQSQKKQSESRAQTPRPEPARQPVPAGSVEIYVGNLSYDLGEEDLRKLFAEYGEVSAARIVVDRYRNKSKGFGFVVMPNRAEAEKAIAAYSEKEYMGRKMRVNEAKNTLTE